MKIKNNGGQLIIKSGGVGQLVLAVVFIVAGLAILPFATSLTNENGEKTSPLLPIAFSLILIVVGVLIAITSKSKSVILSKDGVSSVSTKKMIGGKTQSQNFNSSEIAAIQLMTSQEFNNSSSNSSNKPTRTSTLSILLKDNSVIEIGGSSSNSGFSFNGLDVGSLISKAPLSKEANQLASFLGVPLQAQDMGSISGAIKTVFDNNNTPTTISETNQVPSQPQNPAPTISPQPNKTPSQEQPPQNSQFPPANPQV